MTTAQISRETLFWRDQIIKLRKMVSEADQAWRVEAVKGFSNTEERRLQKGLKYDLDQARKGLEQAVRNFADAAFMDVRAIK
jgi:hypothetical protein